MSRRARELNSDQQAVVGAVKRIAKQRAKVNANYVSTILRAREQGVTYAAIADAAGTSSQAVQEVVRRHQNRVIAVEDAVPGLAAPAADATPAEATPVADVTPAQAPAPEAAPVPEAAPTTGTTAPTRVRASVPEQSRDAGFGISAATGDGTLRNAAAS
ncbi:hypothetical protein [Brevibacterium samyangense]|uniref:Uncharacterized protein n=1 Tax=Brevibacterium samyangense TaxID=366888 RepID=A0ABN2TGX3_9MICO